MGSGTLVVLVPFFGVPLVLQKNILSFAVRIYFAMIGKDGIE
jgi:hypothetical protein